MRKDTAARVRGLYGYRRSRFLARAKAQGLSDVDLEGINKDHDASEDRSLAYQRLVHELVRAQREALIRLRDGNTISDEAFRRVERELDLEEARLEV